MADPPIEYELLTNDIIVTPEISEVTLVVIEGSLETIFTLHQPAVLFRTATEE